MRYFRTLLASATFITTLASPAFAQMAPPKPMTPAQFSALGSGQNCQIMIRVDSVKRESVGATVLQYRTDTEYSATKTHAVLFLPSGTPMVMGAQADVTPGAVLYVYGIVTKAGRVDVKKAVVVTKYTKVE